MNGPLVDQIADAVLYEGYLLYPYRPSVKNRQRWTFGGLYPRAYSEAQSGTDPWSMHTQCLVQGGPGTTLDVTVRFLHLLERRLGEREERWQEAVERQVALAELGLTALVAQPERREFLCTAEPRLEDDREQHTVTGVVELAAEPVEDGLFRVTVGILNETALPAGSRTPEEALLRSFVSTHTLLRVREGEFVSLIDPPQQWREAAPGCHNIGTWPVLVGEEGQKDAMLSSPIILYDYPQVAPESPGDLFDATEIDEILTLRILTLTEEEKQQAAAVDPRAAAIVDRVDALPPEILKRLHGAVRYLRATAAKNASEGERIPWWDPGADKSVSPESDSVQIDGVSVAKGCRVRLRPGQRRSDAQDIFLEGRVAIVEAVFSDVEDKQYLAVTLADDPALDLNRWHGRYLYFYPDEIELLMQG